MEMTMRWFGSNADKIKLSEIAQVPGVKGVVGMIMDIPAGEIWPKERIKSLKEEIFTINFSLSISRKKLNNCVSSSFSTFLLLL